MSQTLEPGIGLGDIKLLETTLEDVITRLGQQQAQSLVVGIDLHQITLSYFPEEIHLQFTAPTRLGITEPVDFDQYTDASCATTISGLGRGRIAEFSDMGAFLSQYPECKSIPLTSVAISAERRGNESYYVGTTDKGIGILTSEEEVIASYGPSDDLMTLEYTDLVSPIVPDWRDERYVSEISYKSGIVFFVDDQSRARTISIFPAIRE